jgi:peptidoglycan hydrolase-like protein with peptidoglycan-binding domain
MISRTLRHGDSGDDVKLVQEFLKNHGYYTGPIDGKFGPGQGFLNSVKAFQKDHELAVDGVIGPATRARIIELMVAPKPADDTATMEYWKDMYSLQAGVVKELQAEVERVKNLAKEIIGKGV